ncbi:MAG: hypothetical protein M1817_001547 [Caeruleum heppii]|nr:MAG: hypothetical protein M1817_001547 [Caeruleum heppii]
MASNAATLVLRDWDMHNGALITLEKPEDLLLCLEEVLNSSDSENGPAIEVVPSSASWCPDVHDIDAANAFLKEQAALVEQDYCAFLRRGLEEPAAAGRLVEAEEEESSQEGSEAAGPSVSSQMEEEQSDCEQGEEMAATVSLALIEGGEESVESEKEEDGGDEESDVEEGENQAESSAAPNYCHCRRPDDGLPMVECDGKTCPYSWYHFSCVGMSLGSNPGFWLCPFCWDNATIKQQRKAGKRPVMVADNGNDDESDEEPPTKRRRVRGLRKASEA